MDAEYANYYTREVMLILIREFQSPDEEMKKIVLKVCQNNNSPSILNMDAKKKSKPNKSKKPPPQIIPYQIIPYTKLTLLGFYFLSGGKAVLWYGWC